MSTGDPFEARIGYSGGLVTRARYPLTILSRMHHEDLPGRLLSPSAEVQPVVRASGWRATLISLLVSKILLRGAA